MLIIESFSVVGVVSLSGSCFVMVMVIPWVKCRPWVISMMYPLFGGMGSVFMGGLVVLLMVVWFWLYSFRYVGVFVVLYACML